MHKVVIERPRWNPGRGKHGRHANLPDELLPKFEGMKRPHACRKGLTDLLGPLKRWLQSQVGRPWNDVYSEACAVIKPDSVIRAHIKTHLLQFVERHSFMHNGTVCILDTGYLGRGIIAVTERRYGCSRFFVHPETGLLHPIPQKSWKALRAQRRAARAENFRRLDCSFALKQIGGHLVRLSVSDCSTRRAVQSVRSFTRTGCGARWTTAARSSIPSLHCETPTLPPRIEALWFAKRSCCRSAVFSRLHM